MLGEVTVKKWLRRIRGAVGMGLTWAIGWAGAGLLIGVASILLPGLPWDVFFQVFDAPLPAFAVPGFVGGMLFSTVLGIAGRRRKFSELSLSTFAAWGAVGGVLLILFPFALVAVGLASTEGSNPQPWQGLAVIGGLFILLSAGSASVTLMLARRSEGREVLDTGSDARPVEGQAPHLLGEAADPSMWVPSAALKDVATPIVRRGPGDA